MSIIQDIFVACVACINILCYTHGMKLYYDKRLSDPTYYVQKGFRNGKKVTSKNVFKIGKHSELLKITDDPLAYAKEQVRIKNEEEKKGLTTLDLHLDFNEKIQNDASQRISPLYTRNIGYFYLQHIYRQLDLASFFKSATIDSKITFSPDLVNRFMVYDRILFPGSKLELLNHKDWFYENPDFDYQHIMRTMDILEDNYDGYISWLFKKSGKIVKRNTSRCFYDCTNFYNEVETADEDYVDEVTGELIKGLRKYGPSKEHRPNPIIEMGLFMDSKGLPMSMCIHPGNESEQNTAIPLEKELIKMFREADKNNSGSFIYVADGGLGSSWIRQFNSMGGRSFIVTQSIKKMSDKLKLAVFNDCDYRMLDGSEEEINQPVSVDFLKTFDKKDPSNLRYYNARAYKIINADSMVDLGFREEKQLKNGSVRMQKAKGLLKQQVIITFSRKMFEYQRAVRNRQIQRARQELSHLDPDTYKKGPNDVTRFIKKTSSAKNGGDVVSTFSIDEERIAEEEKYDGYYALATNLEIETDHVDPASKAVVFKIEDIKDILKISAQRNKIEECFRIMKTNFGGRPLFHRKREHIIAHFMICYTALLIYRILEVQLDEAKCHCTTNEIITTLKHMIVGNVEDRYYLSMYGGSETLTAISRTQGGGLEYKRYFPKTLNKIARSF